MFIQRCILAAAAAVMAAGMGAAEPPNAAAALAQFAKANQTCFIVFYRDRNAAMADMFRAATTAAEQLHGGAEVALVDVNNQVDSDVVARFGAGKASLPLALTVAPNGAVLRAFSESATPKDLLDSVACKPEAALVKALQDGKIVVVSVQNGKSEGAAPAGKAVAAFLADKRLAGFAVAIAVDPADKAAAAFLSRLDVDAAGKAAVTLLLVPPGRIAGKYAGAVDVNQLSADLAAAIAGTTCETDSPR